MTLIEQLLEYLQEEEISPEQIAAVDECFFEGKHEEIKDINYSEIELAKFHEKAQYHYLEVSKYLAGDHSVMDDFPTIKTLKAIAESRPDVIAKMKAALSVPTVKVALIARAVYKVSYLRLDEYQIELRTSLAVVIKLALLMLKHVEGAAPGDEEASIIAMSFLESAVIEAGKKEELHELLRQMDVPLLPLVKIESAAIEDGFRELAKREETKERNFDEDLPVLVFRVFSQVKERPAKPWWKAVYRALKDYPATSHYAANEDAFVQYIHSHLSTWQQEEMSILETDVMTQKKWWEPKVKKVKNTPRYSPVSPSENGAYPGYVKYKWKSYISEAKKEEKKDTLSKFGGEDRAKLMTLIAKLITNWLTEGKPDPHTYELK